MPRKTGTGDRGQGQAARAFNEAAARCRGKPPARGSTKRSGRSSFNEAAARCRGKPPGGTTTLTVTMTLQ